MRKTLRGVKKGTLGRFPHGGGEGDGGDGGSGGDVVVRRGDGAGAGDATGAPAHPSGPPPAVPGAAGGGGGTARASQYGMMPAPSSAAGAGAAGPAGHGGRRPTTLAPAFGPGSRSGGGSPASSAGYGVAVDAPAATPGAGGPSSPGYGPVPSPAPGAAAAAGAGAGAGAGGGGGGGGGTYGPVLPLQASTGSPGGYGGFPSESAAGATPQQHQSPATVSGGSVYSGLPPPGSGAPPGGGYGVAPAAQLPPGSSVGGGAAASTTTTTTASEAELEEARLWAAAEADDGSLYYYHTVTEEVSWDPPAGFEEAQKEKEAAEAPAQQRPASVVNPAMKPAFGPGSEPSPSGGTAAAAAATGGGATYSALPPRNDGALTAKVKGARDVEQQLGVWQQRRGTYRAAASPVLASFDAELGALFARYESQLSTVLAAQSDIDPQLRIVTLDAERARLAKIRQEAFNGEGAAGLDVLDKEVQTRQRVLLLDKQLIKIQAVCRGWLVRKKMRSLIDKRVHRLQIAKEILETEELYVQMLELMVEKMLKPLRARCMTKNQLLSPNELQVVFGNAELILQVNKELLAALRARLDKWDGSRTLLGDAFLDIAPFLKMYVSYVNNYNTAQQTALELATTKPEFVALTREAIRSSPQAMKMGSSLANFLILPVQRVPRYVLLLKDFLKHTDEDHPDYDSLHVALQQIKGVAVRINESQAVAENLQRIYRIQNRLGMDGLLKPHRRLLREGNVLHLRELSLAVPAVGGTLRRAGARNANAVLWLFSDLLLLGHKVHGLTDLVSLSAMSAPGGGEVRFKAEIRLEGARVSADSRQPSQPNVFEVTHPADKAVYRFSADSAKEAADWITAIRGAVDRLRDSSSGRKKIAAAKTKSMRRGHSAAAAAGGRSAGDGAPVFPAFPGSAPVDPNAPSFPAFPGAAQAATPPASPSKTSTVGDAVTAMGRVVELERQLFEVPILLDRLIPEVMDTLPAASVVELHSRFDALRTCVSDLQASTAAVNAGLAREELLARVSRLLDDGGAHIAAVKTWVQKEGASSAEARGARDATAYLLQWYIDIFSAWQELCATTASGSQRGGGTNGNGSGASSSAASPRVTPAATPQPSPSRPVVSSASPAAAATAPPARPPKRPEQQQPAPTTVAAAAPHTAGVDDDDDDDGEIPDFVPDFAP